jgi:hypothetical protein
MRIPAKMRIVYSHIRRDSHFRNPFAFSQPFSYFAYSNQPPMKKLYFFSALLLTGFCNAQTAFWTEDFATGCNRGQLASAYTGTNGAWAITNTGTNDTYADGWYVSATAAGSGAQNCAESCLTSSNMNRSLHVGNAAIAIVNIGPDSGSTYLTGTFCGGGICSVTHKRAESPTINCTGKTNLGVSFVYYENGEADDDATLWYSADGGITWTQIDALPKTNTTACPGMLSMWNEYSVNLPASANNNANVKIGFQWVNDNDGVGTDPSFAVDDVVMLFNVPTTITENNLVINLTNNSGTLQVNSTGEWNLVSVVNVLGQHVSAQRDGESIHVGEHAAGIYLVTLEIMGERVTRKIYLD